MEKDLKDILARLKALEDSRRARREEIERHGKIVSGFMVIFALLAFLFHLAG